VSQPDLFVVCKNCGSEVSPYVTECPYCGQRVRKRAPKIERGGQKPPRKRRRRSRSLPKLRRGEIPGIAPDTRPYATGALIVVSLLATVVWGTGKVSLLDLGAIYGPLGGDWWRLLAAPFVHNNAGYQFVTMVAVGVFGSALERRFGWYVPLFLFLAAGAAGAALAVAAQTWPVMGANGAALGLLTAWYVEYRLTRNDDDADRIGVAVFAAVLLLLSVAWEPASVAAAVGGAAVGAIGGFALAQRR
jgi:membrane associated rhomboid family serine protease/DNA-directed RNA polymerase subunit RPC12/RpoP